MSIPSCLHPGQVYFCKYSVLDSLIPRRSIAASNLVKGWNHPESRSAVDHVPVREVTEFETWISSFVFVIARADISLKFVWSRHKQVKGFRLMLSGNMSEQIVMSVLCIDNMNRSED